MKKRLLAFCSVLGLVLGGCAANTAPLQSPDITAASPDYTLTLPASSAVPNNGGTDGAGEFYDGIPGEGDVHYSLTYDEALTKNADVIGYLSVAGTDIKYPVLRKDDNEYYRGHDITGNQSKYGAVYMDWRNGDKAQQRHIVIYAHNMKDGTMFNGLINFKQQDFFEKNRIISFNWAGSDTLWEIYLAATAVTADGIALDHTRTQFESDDDFAQYMQDIVAYARTQGGGCVFQGASIAPSEQVLTLATCTDEADGSHFFVQARRVR